MTSCGNRDFKPLGRVRPLALTPIFISDLTFWGSVGSLELLGILAVGQNFPTFLLLVSPLRPEKGDQDL